ncbi:hypothetical protein [Paenibacillus alvei]|uniref:Uncharacterized protein n=1 Tax=Paenibacillus alvei TaxID=44250 RepID=A0A383RBF5_PAEAL|nr:hypothetical protein [Paenibacillus alvei]SYX84445.1 conserved protein of unknown function [Paenibacillus alvei]
MSKTTKKLGLKTPEFTDEIHQTLQDLSDNFSVLDNVSNDYSDASPLSEKWRHNYIIWNSKPAIGEYVGWVNTREGRAAPHWKPLQSFTNGDYIIPSTDNGHVYQCIQSGNSGVMEPVFPASADKEVQDTRGAMTWERSKLYVKNDVVFPTIDNGRFYVCITEGESGGIEPSWSLTTGTSVYDGNAVWLGYRIAKWKESGISALFRPFGKID